MVMFRYLQLFAAFGGSLNVAPSGPTEDLRPKPHNGTERWRLARVIGVLASILRFS